VLDHVSLGVADLARSRAFSEKALGPPGPRPRYHPGYYGAFVLDPDGNNIEAVCHRPPA
jgi:catechol 2,3-dioxygenase-like lactoylglutathione lyase family enzyme